MTSHSARTASDLRRLAVLAALFTAPAALAAQYEVEINVTTEEDLYDLYEQDRITEDTLETLVELLQTGVDLNTASREDLYQLPNLTYAQVDAILEYRRLSDGIKDPSELVAAGAISAGDLLIIAPFLVVGPERAKLPFTGHARLVAAGAPTDPALPAGYARLRAAGYDFKGGVAIFNTRRRLGPVTYDSARDALLAPAPVDGVEIPKYYLMWRSSQRTLIAGTFSAGFAESLTLDATTRKTPRGFYPDDVVYRDRDLATACRESPGELDASPCEEAGTSDLRMTPDFSWRDRFRGVAGSVEDLEVGDSARASFYAFGSYATRSIYQYALYDNSRCSDPHDDGNEACAAPTIFVQQPDPSARTSTYKYVTLPSVFDEATGGAHASLTLDDRTTLGVTGYYASPRWTVSGMRLDFQEWHPYPYQGDFGAVGINGATRAGPVNLFIEAARSFDGMPNGGGGFGVVQRSAVSLARYQELEVSLRYYDPKFANPYSRAIAADDRLDGNRVRNEAGLKVSWLGRKMYDFNARATADFWVWPGDMQEPGTAGRTNMELSGRVDFEGWRFLKLGGWVGHVNRNLGRNGLGNCYTDYTNDVDESDTLPEGEIDEPAVCSGERYDVGLRVFSRPLGDVLSLGATYRQAFATTFQRVPAPPPSTGTVSEPTLGSYQTATGEVRAKVREDLQFGGRIRYFHESQRALTRDQDSVWASLDARFRPSRLLHVLLRYDAVWFTHEADQGRIPNPEHRLRLQLETRF